MTISAAQQLLAGSRATATRDDGTQAGLSFMQAHALALALLARAVGHTHTHTHTHTAARPAGLGGA
jgi:hypothetical protein